MRTPAELLERMVDGVLNEPDPARREAVIEEVFSEDVVLTAPRSPGLRFTANGPAREVGDLGMRPWRLGPPGGDAVASGLDVAQVAEGHVVRLWTLLEA